jgi:hypothetical protein
MLNDHDEHYKPSILALKYPLARFLRCTEDTEVDLRLFF